MTIPDRSDAGAKSEVIHSSPDEGLTDGFFHGVDLGKLSILVKGETGVNADLPMLRQGVEVVLARSSAPMKNPTAYVAAAIRKDPSLVTGRAVIARDLAAGTQFCSKAGHEAYPAHNCAGCRTEALSVPNSASSAARPGFPSVRPSTEQARGFGAADVRAMLRLKSTADAEPVQAPERAGGSR